MNRIALEKKLNRKIKSTLFLLPLPAQQLAFDLLVSGETYKAVSEKLLSRFGISLSPSSVGRAWKIILSAN